MARKKDIDIARGIAIICIVIGHMKMKPIQHIVFTFHVPIFYIITGYFIKTKKIIPFIKKRARSLLVPYAATCLAMVIIATVLEIIIGGGISNAGTVAVSWINASLYGSGNSYTEPFVIKEIGAIWFLLASFWGSCFLQISLHFKSYIRQAVIIILFLLGYFTSKFLFWFPFSIQAGCCATLFMYFGYCIQLCNDDLMNLCREVKSSFSILALCVWVTFIIHFKSFWLVRCDIGQGLYDIVGCICGSYCVLLLSKYIELYSRHLSGLLSYFGRNSIIVLCVHIIELNFISWREVASILPAPIWCSSVIAVGMKAIFIASATYFLTQNKLTSKLFLNR